MLCWSKESKSTSSRSSIFY